MNAVIDPPETAIVEAAKLMLQLPLSAIQTGAVGLPTELWRQLYLEMHDWCAKERRTMMVNTELDRPNFMFRGVFVYPVEESDAN